MHELSTRVARSVEICRNRKLFSNNDLWQKRTRACIEVTASLVCCANAKLAWFGGISELLGDIGSFEKIRELSSAGTDELFVTRWTCLSLVAIRQNLGDNQQVQTWAGQAMERFAEQDDTGNNDALLVSPAQRINETLEKASVCLFRLYDELSKTEDHSKIIKILRGHESQLKQINVEADHPEWVDDWIFDMQNAINRYSHRIISEFPGFLDAFKHQYQSPIPFGYVVELCRDPCKRQFICPGQTLKSLCFLSPV